MRVLDIILENNNPLFNLRTTIGAAGSVNRRNSDSSKTSYIQQQLARHRLVTGIRNGQFVLGNMAWTGSIDGQWTAQLDSAIPAWKRSINLQLTGTPDRPLEVNTTSPGILGSDLKYLVNTELGSDGLLDANQRGNPAYTPGDQPGISAGFTYTPGVIPGTRQEVAADPTGRTLYNAVGESAWYRIAAEILEYENSRDGVSWLASTPPTERARLITSKKTQTFERNVGPQITGQWLSNINNYADNAMATYADGSTQPIDISKVFSSPQVVDVFDYYSEMATKLWEKDRQLSAQARQNANTVTQTPVSGEVLGEVDLRAIATQLNNAFKNDLTAAFPGGRSFSNDAEAIQSILARLRTAADFDNLSQIYSQLYSGEVLHERLWEELEKDEYMSIVVPKLLAIRRIAPRIIYTSIEFGDADNVQAEYDGSRYRVMKELGSSGQPIIQGYNGPNDYDAITIDGILKAAVETSGGTLPDFDAPIDDEARAEAQLAFINTVQNTYPEMVAFYVHAEPFSSASVDIGGARMRGIIDDAARMGGNQAAMASYISQEILSDREWLLGTDEVEPAANIRFDDRYRSEGIRGREFPTVSADEDVELNANEEEIYENLKSTQRTVVLSAVDAILQSENPEQMWENIYRQAASDGLWLDKAANMGDGRSSIEEFLNGNDDGSPIVRVARSIGLPITAPRVAAEMFYDAGRGRTMRTDEDTINNLIGQIRNRYDYELIDERYRALSDDSLIDDLASEQIQGIWGGGWYKQLAAIIGDEDRLELIRVELDRGIMDALENVERAPTSENIEALSRAADDNSFKNNEDQLEIVIDRINSVLDDMDATTPESLLLENLRDALQATLNNL